MVAEPLTWLMFPLLTTPSWAVSCIRTKTVVEANEFEVIGKVREFVQPVAVLVEISNKVGAVIVAGPLRSTPLTVYWLVAEKTPVLVVSKPETMAVRERMKPPSTFVTVRLAVAVV